MKKNQTTKAKKTPGKPVEAKPAHRPKHEGNLVKTYVSLTEKQSDRVDKLARKYKCSKAEVHRKLAAFALKNIKDISF